MEWLQNLLSGENGDPLQLVLITLFLVISLILIVWVVRRVAGSPSRRAGRGRIPRLSITDSAAVDDKRYIVMVRRDNVEHLLLIGGPTDVVVETGIVRVQPVANQGETVKQAVRASEEKSVQKKAEAVKEGPLFGGNSATSATVASAGAAAMAPAPTPPVESSEPQVDVPEVSEEISEKAVEAVSEALEEVAAAETVEQPEVESVSVEQPEPETPSEEVTNQETKAPDLEPDLEDTITKKLDDVLSSEDFNVDQKLPPEKDENKQDDEMQRLLEELAGETKKEPA